MLAVGMVFGYKMNAKDAGPLISSVKSDSSSGPIGTVEELIRFVETKYVDTVKREPLVSAAIDAVLQTLDPHSVYIPADQLQYINQEMEGSFDGIGIESFYLQDTVHIIKTVEGSPADGAGIVAFDKLLKVGDENVAGQGFTFEEIEKRIKGAAGDQLELTFLGADGTLKETLVTISDVLISSIASAVNLTKEVGYIKVRRFSSRTYREFMDEFEQMYENGTKHLILDLRGNPGGYLPQATNMLSQLFSEKGKLLVYTEGRKGQRLEYKTTGKPFFYVDRIAVLVDERSASGSEIIAGAIQEWDRGLLLGRRTFGKGLVQEQYNLQNGGAMRITVARYFTPSGRSIQRTYADMDKYDEDLYSRIHSGELFVESSTPVPEQDTTAYKTRLLSRNLQSGGGITPDVFVPIDSLELDFDYLSISSSIPKFVFEYLAKRGTYDQVDEKLVADAVNSFVQSDLMVEEDVYSRLKNNIHRDIRASLLRYIDGDVAEVLYKAAQDQAILEAVDYVTGDRALTDY